MRWCNMIIITLTLGIFYYYKVTYGFSLTRIIFLGEFSRSELTILKGLSVFAALDAYCQMSFHRLCIYPAVSSI